MRDRKSNNKAPLFTPMHVALLLICAVLLTSYATGGLYARYISESSGDAGARVISFGDISLSEADDNSFSEADDNPFILIPGATAKKEVSVNFEGSESATFVFVVIDASDHWNNYDATTRQLQIVDGNDDDVLDSNNDVLDSNNDVLVSISIESGWTYLKTSSAHPYVFYKSLEPNVQLKDKDAQFFGVLDDVQGGIRFSENLTADQISEWIGDNAIYLNLTAIAVQSIGFESVDDAWNSIKSKI